MYNRVNQDDGDFIKLDFVNIKKKFGNRFRRKIEIRKCYICEYKRYLARNCHSVMTWVFMDAQYENYSPGRTAGNGV